MISHSDFTLRRDLLLLFIAIGVFFCIGLGIRPYMTPSEARYIELPRQMLATGDWLTPRINGVPYFEKPPLFYWMQALVMLPFGTGEFAGRFVTAILTSLTCVSTYALARLLYGRAAGLLAAGVLASCIMGYCLSRIAMLDVPVAFFITLCLAFFLGAQHTERRTRKRNRYLAMYAACALAVMSKGLIGAVLPALVIGAWIALLGRWHLLKQVHLLKGLLLFIAITAPWHVLMAQEHPEFLKFYFIHEHITRYLTNAHKRTEPWWFFTIITWLGLLPWSGLLPSLCKRLVWRNPDTLFLLLWIILPLAFFSNSHSKLVPYIFVIFPPLCILLGRELSHLWDYTVPLEPLRHNAMLVVVLFVTLLVAMQFSFALTGKLGLRINTITSHVSLWSLLPMMAALVWLFILTLRPCPSPKLILSLLGFGMISGLSVNFIYAPLDKMTVKPLASQLAPQLQPLDMVVAYGNYWQDLPVYLNRNITVAGWEGELGYGMLHYPQTHDWMISTDTFWKRCKTSVNNVYVFINSDMLKNLNPPSGCRLITVATHGKTVLMKKE